MAWETWKYAHATARSGYLLLVTRASKRGGSDYSGWRAGQDAYAANHMAWC
jgi:hypothetical protein